MDRVKSIIKVSIQGIVFNILLTVVKAIIGLIAGSIAIILDAINNLSDAISQIITIVGMKLSAKKPDKEHPYGHGRIEYITAVVLAVILLLTGITSIKESIEKIIEPTHANYTMISFIILIISVIAKFVFGKYVKKKGKELNSSSLITTGTDSYLDSIITFSTFIAALISKFYGINLEGILGVIFSILIIKSGYEVLIEPLNNIIGVRIDGDLAKKIKEKVNSYTEVKGAYDLILHDYGAKMTIGSVHIEVDDNMNAKEIHKLTKQISTDIFNEFGMILTIGIYASNTYDTELLNIKNTINDVLKKYPEILQMHGLYIDSNNHIISFDIVIDFVEKPEDIRNKIKQELEEIYKNYKFEIIIDTDFSD